MEGKKNKIDGVNFFITAVHEIFYVGSNKTKSAVKHNKKKDNLFN